jgi:hypothetical protein
MAMSRIPSPISAPFAPPDFAIRAILDGLDHVAAGMERKWGLGRLRLLVSDLLRAKFDAQKDKLDAAIGRQPRTVRPGPGRGHEARLGGARQGRYGSRRRAVVPRGLGMRAANADKQAVIAAVRNLGFDPADDNEADALALLGWAREHRTGCSS